MLCPLSVNMAVAFFSLFPVLIFFFSNIFLVDISCSVGCSVHQVLCLPLCTFQLSWSWTRCSTYAWPSWLHKQALIHTLRSDIRLVFSPL